MSKLFVYAKKSLTVVEYGRFSCVLYTKKALMNMLMIDLSIVTWH